MKGRGSSVSKKSAGSTSLFGRGRKLLYGIQITRKSGSFEEGNLVLSYSDPSKMDQGRIWQDKFSPKWFLSAFPSDEINKGYGLVQNPGW